MHLRGRQHRVLHVFAHWLKKSKSGQICAFRGTIRRRGSRHGTVLTRPCRSGGRSGGGGRHRGISRYRRRGRPWGRRNGAAARRGAVAAALPQRGPCGARGGLRRPGGRRGRRGRRGSPPRRPTVCGPAHTDARRVRIVGPSATLAGTPRLGLDPHARPPGIPVRRGLGGRLLPAHRRQWWASVPGGAGSGTRREADVRAGGGDEPKVYCCLPDFPSEAARLSSAKEWVDDVVGWDTGGGGGGRRPRHRMRLDGIESGGARA